MLKDLGFSILVVEDDEEDRIIIDEAFLRIGYGGEVKKFIDAYALLHYLEQIETAAYPGLIVLDNTLPKLKAKDILLQLKSNVRYQKIPVVIYSTIFSPSLKEELISAGAYACFEKGTNMQKVMEIATSLKAMAEGANENDLQESS
jgi:CheY-like chemotaxis protein